MSSTFPFLLLLLCITVASAATFKCAGPTAAARSCNALIGFVPSNATTFSALSSLFHVRSHRDLLAANNLPTSTLPHDTVRAAVAIRIPIHCSCSNGTGTSKDGPIYTVQKGDGLDFISRNIFGGFVTYQEVAVFNGISNPDRIYPGQNVSIPLPCSCDAIEGKAVVHYAHKVTNGSSVTAIAAEFGVKEEELLMLNGIDNPKSLQAEQILDVPLPVCSSSIRNDSLDHNLLIPNGSYAFTANNCVQCSCTSSFLQLQCVPVHGDNSSKCREATCTGSTLTLGQSLAGDSPCVNTTCSYAGYGKHAIFTVLNNVSTCSPGSAPTPSPSGSNDANILVGWRLLGWMELLLIICAFFSLGLI